jgi:3,4-dihydroxy 2-butanone 4-phosphate synthase/GTP cyclohydrolase II
MNSDKIYGTTIFIGSKDVELKYGVFRTYTYQDIVDKKYIICLTYGNLQESDSIYTRIHSSCLTSETLRSMDCDCVHQLNSALENIVNKKSGILFYFMQSGRGASYISKSRGCQLVQYKQDSITTFEAYRLMGLNDDYRDYRNVKDICTMLKVLDKDYYLMTNNPDKIKKLQELGIGVKDIVSIEFPPNQFNQQYLMSKKQSGHLLYDEKIKTKIDNVTQQPSVKPFEPYHLSESSRFIHCSTYYLPIKPVHNKIIISEKEMNESMIHDNVISYEKLVDGNYLVEIQRYDVTKKPYWWKTYVYYDITTHREFIVMTYGDLDKFVPIVRIHYEFIFNRFPLVDTGHKNKFKKAIYESVKNGSGIIVFANHNGDDSSIGHYILEKAAFEETGIIPKKNYLPSMLLLKHHVQDSDIKMMYSNSSRNELEKALVLANISIIEWISCEDDVFGHNLLHSRLSAVITHLESIANNKLSLDIPVGSKIIVTGIGSSESHAKYFVNLVDGLGYDSRFLPISDVDICEIKNDNYLIVISQGMSPHGILPITRIKNENLSNVILLTAVTRNNLNEDKVSVINNLNDNGGRVCNYPLEDEYTVLMRICGPISCFYLIYNLFNENSCFDIVNDRLIDINNSIINKITNRFIDTLVETQSLMILVPDHMIDYCRNLKYKFIEGCFIKNVELVGHNEFAHGFYQHLEYWRASNKLTNIIAVDTNDKINTVISMYHVLYFNTCLPKNLEIIELEYTFNKLVINIINKLNINQIDWAGKNDQHTIYSKN